MILTHTFQTISKSCTLNSLKLNEKHFLYSTYACEYTDSIYRGLKPISHKLEGLLRCWMVMAAFLQWVWLVGFWVISAAPIEYVFAQIAQRSIFYDSFRWQYRLEGPIRPRWLKSHLLHAFCRGFRVRCLDIIWAWAQRMCQNAKKCIIKRTLLRKSASHSM